MTFFEEFRQKWPGGFHAIASGQGGGTAPAAPASGTTADDTTKTADDTTITADNA